MEKVPFILLSLLSIFASYGLQAQPLVELDGRHLEIRPHDQNPESKPMAFLSTRAFHAKTSGAELELKDPNALFDFDIYAKPGAISFVGDGQRANVFDLEPKTFDLIQEIDLFILKNFYIRDSYNGFVFMTKDGEFKKDGLHTIFSNLDFYCEKKGQGFQAIIENCIESFELKNLKGTKEGSFSISFSHYKNEALKFLRNLELSFKNIVIEASAFRSNLTRLALQLDFLKEALSLNIEGLSFICEKNPYYQSFILGQFLEYCSKHTHANVKKINASSDQGLSLSALETTLDISDSGIKVTLQDEFKYQKDKLKTRGEKLKLYCIKKDSFRHDEPEDYVDSCLDSFSAVPLDSTSHVTIDYQLEVGNLNIKVMPDRIKTLDKKLIIKADQAFSQIGDFNIETQRARLECLPQEGDKKEVFKNCKKTFELSTEGSVLSSDTDEALYVTTKSDSLKVEDSRVLKFNLQELQMKFKDDIKAIEEIKGHCRWDESRDIFNKEDIIAGCLEGARFDLLSLKSIEKNFSKDEEEKRRSFLKRFKGSFRDVNLSELIERVSVGIRDHYLRGSASLKLPLIGMQEARVEGALRFGPNRKSLELDLDKLKVLGISLNKSEFVLRMIDKLPLIEVVDFKNSVIKVEVLK